MPTKRGTSSRSSPASATSTPASNGSPDPAGRQPSAFFLGPPPDAGRHGHVLERDADGLENRHVPTGGLGPCLAAARTTRQVTCEIEDPVLGQRAVFQRQNEITRFRKRLAPILYENPRRPAHRRVVEFARIGQGRADRRDEAAGLEQAAVEQR